MSYFLPQLGVAVVIELALLVVLVVTGFDRGAGKWIVTTIGIFTVPVSVFALYAWELAKVGSGWGNGAIYIVWMITLPVQLFISVMMLAIVRRVMG